uniref:Uncharacterized protein n=1 Tax=Tetranychus urticae TaxID=32264 RepID=T1KVV5_TETUR
MVTLNQLLHQRVKDGVHRFSLVSHLCGVLVLIFFNSPSINCFKLDAWMV